MLVAIGIVFTGVAAAAPAHASSVRSEAVIVMASNSDDAARAVRSVDGVVDGALPIVSGVVAHVSPDGLAALESDAAVRVTPDVALHPTSDSFDPSVVDPQVAAVQPGADWSADAGRGVGVALVDTGVVDSPDLHGSRLVRSPDFSGEGDGIDHYGHGTFMAGLIAGDGSASAGTRPRHSGVAPGATLVSVKVAGADGSSSLSRVLAGIGWVVTHRDAYNIGVLNLSFGVDTPLPYFFNPLSAASEVAWASGITVVVSAGNRGSDGVTSPGDDPYLITVGSTDAAGNVPAWSGRENFGRYSKPDVTAPGVSVISLRAPGSTIDMQHPEGRLGNNYFRGTGTSMSTAVTSGAVAVLLSHHGDETPDDVKGALVDGATGSANAISIAGADSAPARRDWDQRYLVAFGGFGRGMIDGMPWTATRWTATRWTATRWTATRWTATRWTATRWTDTDWANFDWSATRWTATRWTATRWTADSWPSQSWG